MSRQNHERLAADRSCELETRLQRRATIAFAVAIVLAIPGAFGLVVLLFIGVLALYAGLHDFHLVRFVAGTFAYLLVLAPALIGFRQLAFYWGRLRGNRDGRPGIWWGSATLLNLVVTLWCLGWLGMSVETGLTADAIGAMAATAVAAALTYNAWAALSEERNLEQFIRWREVAGNPHLPIA